MFRRVHCRRTLPYNAQDVNIGAQKGLGMAFVQATGPDGQALPADPAVAKDLCSVTFSEQPQSLFLVAR